MEILETPREAAHRDEIGTMMMHEQIHSERVRLPEGAYCVTTGWTQREEAEECVL